MTQTISSGVDAFGARPTVRILADRCAGCQECVIRCPTGALSMDAKRWVALDDSDLCVGCRQCERTCPFSAIVVEGPMLVGPRVDPLPNHPVHLRGDIQEIRSGFIGWTEALAEADRCLQCPDPTCVRGCPAHNDIPGFIAAVRERDLAGAHQILARTSVIPDICSRVCNQAAQCEGACSWSLAGGTPVAIGRLERFVADNMPVPSPTVVPVADPLSVGIVGSGPAAAGAAWDLVEAGAAVTVYEKDEVPGGLCVWGIPDFTLAEDIALRPWRQLERAGLDLRCEVEIHAKDLDRLLAIHDALIIANGAGVPLRLPVPGADLDGVVEATSFLQGARVALDPTGDPRAFCTTLGLGDADVGRSAHVLVLGAGNTAMDVARTARRLGMSATCIDWLDERFALARPDELAEARHEGVEIRFSHTLTALRGVSGRVARADLARTEQNRADKRPKVLADDAVEMEVDLVVMAMGYRNDPDFVNVLPGTPLRRETAGVADRRWQASGILANPASAYANHNDVGALALKREVSLWAAALPVSERLWVVGDALTGPATVVEAMAQGRRAARAVLDACPTRPDGTDHASSRRSERVLVCYASVGGKTARAAQEIADGFAAHGLVATVLPISKVGARELASTDYVVVGTWVEGFVVAGVGPARAMRKWLERLPRLGAKPVAIFCTFGVSSKGTLSSMRRALEATGALVVAQAAFGPKELGTAGGVFGPRSFGEQLANKATAKEETSVPVA
jgi:glutamate synthase (NADPH/NADH) small chain